ncbi:MAG: peptidoglycan editing factor PgeF [Alphaproteobacteria bacterium]|nr:peptidoglycan editing factor PgeF [Alphaproteobacteria bacterium]
MSKEIFESPGLKSVPGIQHGFFAKGWGSPHLGDPLLPSVMAARARVAEKLGAAPGRFAWCRQIHSPDVLTVSEPWGPNDAARADALVTSQKGVALEIMSADCVPVLFADKTASVIGAAHAGWRGALGGVLENTVLAMEKLGAKRETIAVALGPCIGQPSYEVGADYPTPFLRENQANHQFFIFDSKKGSYFFDLQGYVVKKLRDFGVGSVEGSFADTCADSARFFSHRFSTLQGKNRDGNLISAIILT